MNLLSLLGLLSFNGDREKGEERGRNREGEVEGEGERERERERERGYFHPAISGVLATRGIHQS